MEVPVSFLHEAGIGEDRGHPFRSDIHARIVIRVVFVTWR